MFGLILAISVLAVGTWMLYESRRPDAPSVRDARSLVVFISSRIGELQREREVVQETILRHFGFIVSTWRFETAPASSERLAESYLGQVRRSDFLVLIVGAGIAQPVIDEYHTAREAGIPVLVFVKESERTPEAAAFVTTIVEKYAVFHTCEDLAPAVAEAVRQELVDGYRRYGIDAVALLALSVSLAPEKTFESVPVPEHHPPHAQHPLQDWRGLRRVPQVLDDLNLMHGFVRAREALGMEGATAARRRLREFDEFLSRHRELAWLPFYVESKILTRYYDALLERLEFSLVLHQQGSDRYAQALDEFAIRCGWLRDDRLVALAEELVCLCPHDARSRTRLAFVLLAYGNRASALHELRLAQRLMPPLPKYAFNDGWLDAKRERERLWVIASTGAALHPPTRHTTQYDRRHVALQKGRWNGPWHRISDPALCPLRTTS